jgi:hypothetical protein
MGAFFDRLVGSDPLRRSRGGSPRGGSAPPLTGPVGAGCVTEKPSAQMWFASQLTCSSERDWPSTRVDSRKDGRGEMLESFHPGSHA